MTSAVEHTDRIELDGVGKRYSSSSGDVVAVDAMDLSIDRGEFVCVVGPSGCGKTTLLKMLSGFESPTQGRIRIDGIEVNGPAPERGVVFQQPNLFPWNSVQGNVEFGLRAQKVPKAERKTRASEMIELVGLAGYAEKKSYELSGGMQQRAQLARVLAVDPRVILMDEPFGALDEFTRQRLQVQLLKLWNHDAKTIVFVTHSVEEAVFLGTRVLVMSAGPGRVTLDRRLSLPGDTPDGVRSPDVIATPEFQEIKSELTRAIVEAHG